MTWRGHPALQPFAAPDERPAGARREEVPFQAHADLLGFFLARRGAIVEGIEGLLNAQRKPAEYLQDRARLARLLEDAFFTLPGVTGDRSRLRGRLEAAHWATGFRPKALPGLHNALVDPAEMMVRGFHLWQQTRWPGRSGRLRYAQTVFNLYVLRQLALLSMRVLDAGPDGAGGRLAQVQDLLDWLWATAPADQPPLVQDARWLIPLAQSPATDELGPYLDAAEQLASLPDTDRLEVHKASVRLAAGHLRSQIRYYALNTGVPIDDPGLVSATRRTNALDFALLIQDLVPLLEAYEDACRRGDREERLALADVICQGVSPDPELFLNRLELLGAYSMIEPLFVGASGDGSPGYTAMGQRHVDLLHQYRSRIPRVSQPLSEDGPRFRPVAGAYSPYGALYGFSSDLIEHMALKTLQPDPVPRFGLEDVFTAGGDAAAKLAWVNGWRRLPHVPREVARQFEYPHQFAEAVFARIEHALRRRVLDGGAKETPTGRLFVVPAGDPPGASAASGIPDLPLRYLQSSDAQIVAAHQAEARDESHLSSDRREGRCLLSYRTAGGWTAISKALLTEVLGAGRDATLRGLPPAAAAALKLLGRDLVVLAEDAAPGSPGHPL